MAPILQKPCLVREVDLYVWQKHSRKSQELSQACWLGYYEMGRGSRKLKELLGRWGKLSEGAPSHVEGTESLHGTWGKKYPDNGVSVWEMRTFPVWDISLLEGFHCMIRKMTSKTERTSADPITEHTLKNHARGLIWPLIWKILGPKDRALGAMDAKQEHLQWHFLD